jgi:hypothetical protein
MAVKVDSLLGTGGMRIRFPARSWELAHDVIEDLKANPPRGYRMIESRVQPRGTRKSGKRCNVRLTFNYIDDRIPKLATGGAKAFFEPYELRAQGVDDGA